MLCGACQRIFKDFSYCDTDHQINAQQLGRAAMEGCFICRVLWRDFESVLSHRGPSRAKDVAGPSPISKYNLGLRMNRSKAPTHMLSLQITIFEDNDHRSGSLITFRLQALSEARRFFNIEELSIANSWNSSTGTARMWLRECLEKHDRCRATLPHEIVGAKHPTRLLQIGQPEEDKVRLLLHPDQVGTKVQYATASHCWGQSPVLKLTSGSSLRLQQGIAFTELGKTFQDVLFITHSLGIQFLWVDALCIFQDSREDWEREAPLMCNVYRCALINIAASAAIDNEAGCLHARDPSQIKPCIIQTAWNNRQNDTYHLYHDSFWDSSLAEMPLLRRAWVFQELLLAPRILHLGGSQLFWECFDLTACESYPHGKPPTGNGIENFREVMWYALCKTKPPEDILKGPLAPSSTGWWQLWDEIIRRYTYRKLSHGTDRLAGLSGIVKVMEPLLNDKYHAGIWQKMLVQQLHWHSSSAQTVCARPAIYQAPSWSWASIDGQISPSSSAKFNANTKPLVDIINCEIESPGDDTSVVTKGTLKLTGWLVTLQLYAFPPSKIWPILFNGLWRKDFVHQACPGVFIIFDCLPLTLQFHCLPLFVTRSTSTEGWHLSGLLLCPTGDIKGQFQRFGYIHINRGGFDMDDWRSFRNAKNEDWLEYESVGEKCGQYLISII